MEVEGTLARGSHYSPVLAVAQHSFGCLLVGCGVIDFVAFVVCLAVGMATSWKMAGFWLFVFVVFLAAGVICSSVIGWHVYLIKRAKDDEHARAKAEIRLLNKTTALVDDAIKKGDTVDFTRNEDKGIVDVKVTRVAAQLPRVKQAMLSAPGSVASPAALPPAGDVVEDEPSLPLPKAPAFWDMVDLITSERMPLCFVVDDNPKSKTYGQTVPAFGTMIDLLSVAVIGKPGRGKTVLLIYYTCCLLKCGAEVHIFDPHGVMAVLRLLHGCRLPNMPETARVYYYDTKEEMTSAVPALLDEIQDRDQLYRPHLEDGVMVIEKVKHPLLVLADELPILADFDDQNKAEYKEMNQRRRQEGEPLLRVPLLSYLFRRTVMEARKWNCYFIGSSQSIDATILPTKVTDALNSRIVFFNTDRKARMAGLEAEVIKKMLPLIRRAGPGFTIYDCGRWDTPKIGAIPNVSVEDLLRFLGLSMDDLTQMWVAEYGDGDGLGTVGAGSVGAFGPSMLVPSKSALNVSQTSVGRVTDRITGELKTTTNEPLELVGVVPDMAPTALGPGDMEFTSEQVAEFIKLYKGLRNRKETLRRMRNPRTQSGFGLSNRYDKHAQIIVDQYQLDR